MNTITITKRTITYKHQIINVANISTVNLEEKFYNHRLEKRVVPRLRKRGYRLLIASFVVFFLGIVSFSFIKVEAIPIITVMLTLGAFILSVSSFSKSNVKIMVFDTEWVLSIVTNSGTNKLFSQKKKNYEFINKVRLKILDAINDEGENFNMAFNVDNRTIINTPTVNITNVTKYTGLSEDDKQFIANSFEPALQKIKSEIEDLKDDELSRNLEMILNEMKLEKPRKPIIESAWEAISVVSNLAEAVNNVTRGINMFS